MNDMSFFFTVLLIIVLILVLILVLIWILRPYKNYTDFKKQSRYSKILFYRVFFITLVGLFFCILEIIKKVF